MSKLILCLTLVIFALILPKGLLAFDSYNYFIEYRSPENLAFEVGDIIACRIESNIGGQIVGAEHAMLVTKDKDVAHIVVNGNSGNLREENFKDVIQRNRHVLCRIATGQYDTIMYDLGIPPKRTPEMLIAARGNVGDNVYYDFSGCNCQHWVTSWRYGKAWSIQSHQPPNPRCALDDEISTRPRGRASAYANGYQSRASADAYVGKKTFGHNIMNGEATGPSAGAHAEAGTQSTGWGFKASLGQVKVGLGKSAGLTTGLNVDSGVSLGTDGVRYQVLGTGFQFSRSKGSKVCIWGSCLHWG